MVQNVLEPGDFLGDARSMRVADAILSEVVHLSERSLPIHSHAWPYASMLLQGFYTETVDDKTIEYAPFTAVFHGANLAHHDVIGSGGARFFLIEFGESWSEHIERLGGMPRHAYALHGEGASWPALRAYHRFVTQTAFEDEVEGILFELCGHLPKSLPPDAIEPQWLSEVQAHLVRDFRKPYSLRTLAAAVFVDASHLTRTFHRFRGCTIGEFVNRLRVQQACRELAELDQSLESIARANGFSDQSHMTRAIRQLAGDTPAALRRAFALGERKT